MPPSTTPPATSIGQTLSVDIHKLSIPTPGGYTHELTAVDEKSGRIDVVASKSKKPTDIYAALWQVLQLYNQSRFVVRHIHVDAEYCFPPLKAALGSIAILLTASTPEQHAQRVERYTQTLDIKVTAALQSMSYDLPAKYMIYAKQHAAHMMNIVPNSRSFPSTAHILTMHSKPHIPILLQFGATAMVRMGKDKRTSLASSRSIHTQHTPKSELGVFLGFNDMYPTSYMFLLANGKVVPRHIASLVNVAPFGWGARTPLRSVPQLPRPSPRLDLQQPAPSLELVQMATPPVIQQPPVFDRNNRFSVLDQDDKHLSTTRIGTPQQPAPPPLALLPPLPTAPSPSETIQPVPTVDSTQHPPLTTAPDIKQTAVIDTAPLTQPTSATTPSLRPRLPRQAARPAINVQQAGRDSISRTPATTSVSFAALPRGQHRADPTHTPAADTAAATLLVPGQAAAASQHSPLLTANTTTTEVAKAARKAVRTAKQAFAATARSNEASSTVPLVFGPKKEISVKKALLSPDADLHLRPAINKEMTKLTTQYQAIEEIAAKDIPADAVRLRSKMFVVWKRDAAGKVTRANARLACGGNDQPKDSYRETYAPTVDKNTTKVAIAAFHADAVENNYVKELCMSDFDVPGAFLNIALDKTSCPRPIVMRIQDDLPHPLAGKWVLIKKGVYGLKQSNNLFELDIRKQFKAAG